MGVVALRFYAGGSAWFWGAFVRGVEVGVVVYARGWASFSAPMRRGASDVVLWSGFGGAGAWLWGLGVQHVDVAGSREGWGSLRCLVCLGSALVGRLGGSLAGLLVFFDF